MAEGSAPGGRITNNGELQEWLESVEDRRVLCAFAARNALRCTPAVLSPLFENRLSANKNKLTLGALRATLVSAVAGASPSQPNLAEQFATARKVYDIKLGGAYYQADFGDAMRSAVYACRTVYSSNPAHSSLAAYSSAYAARARYSKAESGALAAFSDANALNSMTPTRVMELPLWLAGQRSAVWNEMWQSFCIIEETNEDWNFWRRWYQAFLGEQPLAWDLQRRISVGVKDEAWNQGIEAVSFEIAQIEADWEKENFEEPASELTAGEDPYWNDETARGLPIISEGEAKSLREELHLRAEVTLPETTARFDVTTVKVTSERAVRLAVDRVIDAFDDAKRLCGHNGFNEQRVEVVILDRAHAKYLEDAERLAFDYTDARLSLTQAIEDELPADSALQILISALGVAVTEICAADPEIEKALERNYKRDDTDDDDEPPTRDGETTLLLTDAMRVFPEISSDALAERLQDGLSEVLTGEIVSDTPFDTVDGETQLRHAARRSVVAEMASLTSDMYLKLRAAPKSVQEKLAKHSDSEVFKAVGVTARYSGALALIGAVAKYLAGLLGL